MNHQMYVSYLVRFWREENEDELEDGWRAEVESVQTGQKWRLHTLSDLLQFIQTQMDARPSGLSETDQEC